jgi:hypothetical protein
MLDTSSTQKVRLAVLRFQRISAMVSANPLMISGA